MAKAGVCNAHSVPCDWSYPRKRRYGKPCWSDGPDCCKKINPFLDFLAEAYCFLIVSCTLYSKYPLVLQTRKLEEPRFGTFVWPWCMTWPLEFMVMPQAKYVALDRSGSCVELLSFLAIRWLQRRVHTSTEWGLVLERLPVLSMPPT